MPFKSSEGRNQGKMTKSFDTKYIGGYLLKSATNSQYFYDTDTETTLIVEPGIKDIVIMGVAPGGNGLPAYNSTSGRKGAGGGAGNITGYSISATSYYDQTLYIKVPASPGSPVYVKTGSHSGTSIWEAGHGNPNGTGGVMIVGTGVSGGDGGPNGAPSGSNGSNKTGAGAGGGGGGNNMFSASSSASGGSGGTTYVPTYAQPLGPIVGPAGPWSMSGSPGGSGGPEEARAGSPAPGTGGAQGFPAPGYWPNRNAGSGGGGGGILLTMNGVTKSYGGGAGGGGSSYGYNHQPPGAAIGGGGFIIIQLVKHT